MNVKYHITTTMLTINEGPQPGTPRHEQDKYDIHAHETVVNEYRSQATNATYELLASIAEDTTSVPSVRSSASLDPSNVRTITPNHSPFTFNPSSSSSVPLPPELATPEAMLLWEKLHAADLVDADYRPLPDTRKGDIMWMAKSMSAHLFPYDKPHWQPFEQYWGTKRLNQEYFHYNETGRKPKRAKDIERAISAQ